MVENFCLSNGLRVIVERMPQLNSVSIGVWLRAGSMLESPAENGLAHLMEHMAFKRTERRSAIDLAREMDAIGGHMNAATSKLYTTYYAKVMDRDLPQAIDLLADICCHPVIDAQDLEKEKGVVIEEIAMAEDMPEDLLYDLINEALYQGQSLAMRITGGKEAIARYTREDLLRFRAKYYSPKNTVISVAGRIRTDDLLAMLEEHFGAWQGGEAVDYPANQANLQPLRLAREKKAEQVHIGLGFSGLASTDPMRHSMLALSTILGGGVSSRLFQRVREELGLVYSIYSAPSSYPGCGDLEIVAAVSPRNTKRVLSEIARERDRLLADGISPAELQQAKAQLRTGFVLSQESAYSRMSSMGYNLLIRGRHVPPSEILRGIDVVTETKVLRLARRVFGAPMSMAVVGKRPDQYLAHYT